MGNRLEAILRIPIGFVCGLMLGIWKVVVQVVVLIHFVYAIITGKRNKGMAEFCNKWVTYAYNYLRYMTFTTNKRPFPFEDFGPEKDKVDMK